MTNYSLRARMMILILAPTVLIGLLLSIFFVVHRYNDLQRQLEDAGASIIEPLAVSSEYGMNLQIYGMPKAGQQVVVRGAPGSDSFVLFYLEAGVVQAAIGPNAARDLRFARRLIEQQRPVDAQRLADTATAMSKL